MPLQKGEDVSPIYSNDLEGMLVFKNAPVNSKSQLVIEADAPECLRDEDSQLLVSEQFFESGKTSCAVLPSLIYKPNRKIVISGIEDIATSPKPILVDGGRPYIPNIANGVPVASINGNTGTISIGAFLSSEFGNGTYAVDVSITDSS